MKNHRVDSIIQTIAMNNEISIQQVTQEIQFAINEAYQTAAKNKDMQTLTKLQEISGNGKCPTTEDVILWLVKRIKGLS